jgi:hypothetical protein
VATIRTIAGNDHHYVSVRGPLHTEEVGQLERACAKALESRRLQLTIDLDDDRVSPPAREFLMRLHTRGARLTGAGGEALLQGDHHQ